MSNIITYVGNQPQQVEEEKKKEKILMPEKAKEMLKTLYLYRSYSGFEEPIRNAIMAFLAKLKIPYVNFNGNILGFNHPGAPLFSAHMDMVNTEYYKLKPNEIAVEGDYVFTMDSKACIRLYRDAEKKHQTSLGADDKNGIWVILMLLQQKEKINFAFCHSEETGGMGSSQIVADPDCKKFISDCQYGIIIDRRNEGDIIGYENKYCMALDDRLAAFAKEKGFPYKPARGSVSDADRFSKLIECVNLSCGYYEPHSSREYTNVNELWRTFLFCREMLKSFNYHSVSTKRMEEFKNITTTTSSGWASNKSTSTATKTYYDDDDDFNDYYRNRYGNNYSSVTTTDTKKKLRKRKRHR